MSKNRSNINFIMIYVLGLFLIFLNSRGFCDAAEINIFTNNKKGEVKKYLFGNNLLGYEGGVCSDYGAGIWDPKWNESVKEVIDLAKEAGITILRFPGGCGTHHYNWKNAIGKKREHFLYGVDEFLKTCEEIGAEAVITVSYFTEDESDAADLVEYFNSPNDGRNPNGGIDWAAERAKNGRHQAYDVKYFEIGNEVWHGDHRDIKKVEPEEYAKRYLKYYEAMKAVDPTIKIGVVLYTQEWNRRVLEIVKDKLDFGIIHIYPTPVWGEGLSSIPVDAIFGITFALPELKYQSYINDIQTILKKYADKEVPLAVTEFNCGFVQNKPVPYRHTLGCALVNAELLKIFMRPENNILMANYWNFNNSYTGMIANGFDGTYKTLNRPYYKRPNYYVFEMYNQHFGDKLLEIEVSCDTYDVSKFKMYKKDIGLLDGHIEGEDLLVDSRWVNNSLDGVAVRGESDVLSIEFKNPNKGNYYHTFKSCKAEPATVYIVSGFIKTEDLDDNEGVCLEVQDTRGWTATHFAAQTERVRGTTDWMYVEKVFETLPDAQGIKVIARRNSNELPLKGQAYFKDVKLYRFVPKIDVPYLSVNASKNEQGDTVYLMVINKNMDKSVTSKIELQYFEPASNGNAWVLNGPSIDATNEKNPNNVKIRHKTFEIKGNPFEFTFEPHSLTAIEVKRAKQ